ncbi:hypothetical protein G9A89_000504, partial [Geosiphon pyriformis]
MPPQPEAPPPPTPSSVNGHYFCTTVPPQVLDDPGAGADRGLRRLVLPSPSRRGNPIGYGGLGTLDMVAILGPPLVPYGWVLEFRDLGLTVVFIPSSTPHGPQGDGELIVPQCVGQSLGSHGIGNPPFYCIGCVKEIVWDWFGPVWDLVKGWLSKGLVEYLDWLYTW